MHSPEINDLSAADRFFPDLTSYTASDIWNTNYYLLICRRGTGGEQS